MSSIVVAGAGAVSPAGWGMAALEEALRQNAAPPIKELTAPGAKAPLRVRVVPPPSRKPEFLAHPRVRRTSPISHYSVASALEALGPDVPKVSAGQLSLGIVFCVMCGCVNYSRRFYDETLKDPATASPLVFPETVFNAPASHLSAVLGNPGINYTLVGDQGAFLLGLVQAAHWLETKRVEACLVIGAEEIDWLTATAASIFDPGFVLGEGAGALYLKRGALAGEPLSSGGAIIALETVTDAVLFTTRRSRLEAARRCREALEPFEPAELLCDGLQGSEKSDREESAAWGDWKGRRLSLKRLLGEGFMASSAWQCAFAVTELRSGSAGRATVPVVGANQQAVAARFTRL